MRLRRRALKQLEPMSVDITGSSSGRYPPEEEKEEKGCKNDNCEENPSSPIIPTGVTVVLVTEVIDAAAEDCQSEA